MKTASSTLFQLLREESSVSEDSVFGIHLFANWYKYTCNVFMRTKIHVTFSWDYLWLAEWGNAVKNHHFTPKCSPDVSLQIIPNRNCTFSWTSDSITWSPLPWKLDLLMENVDSFLTSDMITSNHPQPSPSKMELFMENFNIAETSMCNGLPSRLQLPICWYNEKNALPN